MRTRHRKTGNDVLLIHMPFNELSWPHLGLSLLKSSLSKNEISTKILYLNITFAKFIGAKSYLKILEHSNRYNQVCEWMFSGALFGVSKRHDTKYIEEILKTPPKSHKRFFPNPMPEKIVQTVLAARSRVNRFLKECEKEVLDQNPRLVGFSSTYQQHVASLALAKRIKRHSPDTCIVFGGPNCQGILGAETVRQFPFVDAVVSGEGDLVFPVIVQRILEGKSLAGLSGVYTQAVLPPSSKSGRYPDTPSVQDIDALPYPDYDDFFNQMELCRNDLHRPKSIPIETSRGCWWGERKHCTFCSLNGANIRYRTKSGKRVLRELIQLSRQYPVSEIQMNDNAFSNEFFKTLLPDLAKNHSGVKFTCCVRSNLTREQVQLLHDANFRAIQPGVESLSSPVLKLMQKGVRQLENVRILKLCKEFNILPIWNLLCGFPSEPEEEYARMANLIPMLFHLTPPHGTGAFFLGRFSPNFENAETLGLSDVFPVPAYNFIYPFESGTVFNLSSFFTYNYRSGQNFDKYVTPVINEWKAWRRLADSSDLFFVDEDKKLFVWDQRPCAIEPITILSGLQKVLYIACDGIQTISQLITVAETYARKKYSKNDIQRLLQPIMDLRLIIREADRYLSLAIPVGNYMPKREVFEQFQDYLYRIKANERRETLLKNINIKELSGNFKIGEEEMLKFKI